MKADIHPTYYPDAKISCACGNELIVGSTVKSIHVELCAKCHPFYTGKQKLIDTERRVEKFIEKASKMTKGAVIGKKAKAEKRAKTKAEKKTAKQPEMLVEE